MFLVPGTLNIPKQPFSWNRCFVETLKKTIFYIMIWSLPNETKHLIHGWFLKWWYPQKHPKMIIFSRKTHGFVGETHHFRQPLHGKNPPSSPMIQLLTQIGFSAPLRSPTYEPRNKTWLFSVLYRGLYYPIIQGLS